MSNHLSNSEIKLIQLLIDNYGDRKDLHKKLNIAESTLKSHVNNAIVKLGVHNTCGLCIRAIELGYVELNKKEKML